MEAVSAREAGKKRADLQFFRLVTPGRLWTLAAESADDLSMWVVELKRAIGTSKQ